MGIRNEILAALNHCGCNGSYAVLKTDSIMNRIEKNIEKVIDKRIEYLENHKEDIIKEILNES